MQGFAVFMFLLGGVLFVPSARRHCGVVLVPWWRVILVPTVLAVGTALALDVFYEFSSSVPQRLEPFK
jgi:hypothetical protein